MFDDDALYDGINNTGSDDGDIDDIIRNVDVSIFNYPPITIATMIVTMLASTTTATQLRLNINDD